MLAGAVGFDFHLPALALGVACVHAEQVAGKDRRFVTASAGAHFQKQVAVVARIARYQQRCKLCIELFQARLCSGDFLFGQFAHLRVVAQRFGRGQVGLGARLLFQRHRHRLQLRQFARERTERVVVAHHVGVGEQVLQFFAALGQRFELTAQGRRHRSSRSG